MWFFFFCADLQRIRSLTHFKCNEISTWGVVEHLSKGSLDDGGQEQQDSTRQEKREREKKKKRES